MTPENLDILLERACGSPEYQALCLAILLYEKGAYDDLKRLQQIGECLIDTLAVARINKL